METSFRGKWMFYGEKLNIVEDSDWKRLIVCFPIHFLELKLELV